MEMFSAIMDLLLLGLIGVNLWISIFTDDKLEKIILMLWIIILMLWLLL